MRQVESSLQVQSLSWQSIQQCKFWFAPTEILDLIHRTYFYGIQQMGMNDTSVIAGINLTFIALTAMAIHHCLLAWKTGEFRVPPEFGPGGGAQHKWDTRNINPKVDSACTDVFRRLDADFRCYPQEVQAKTIHIMRIMIRQRIQSTGTDPAMVQPDNDHGSFDEAFLDYIPEELIEQRINSLKRLCSIVASTEASIRFPAVLPMCESAIDSSIQPVPGSNSNSNSNDITNGTSVGNTGLVDGSTIVEGAMSLGC